VCSEYTARNRFGPWPLPQSKENRPIGLSILVNVINSSPHFPCPAEEVTDQIDFAQCTYPTSLSRNLLPVWLWPKLYSAWLWTRLHLAWFWSRLYPTWLRSRLFLSQVDISLEGSSCYIKHLLKTFAFYLSFLWRLKYYHNIIPGVTSKGLHDSFLSHNWRTRAWLPKNR